MVSGMTEGNCFLCNKPLTKSRHPVSVTVEVRVRELDKYLINGPHNEWICHGCYAKAEAMDAQTGLT